MRQSLVEVNTDIVDAVGTCHSGRVEATACLLTGHLHQTLHPEALVLVKHTFHTGTTDISLCRHTTGGLDGLRKTEVLGGQRIVALEEHLTNHLDVTLGLIARTLTYIDLIVRHEDETRINLYLIALLDRERESLGDGLVGSGSRRIADTTRHIDTSRRCGICRSACLENQILDGLVVGKLILARELHLTMDGHRTTAHRLDAVRDEELILVLQWHISHCTSHDAVDIDRDDTTRTIGLHAMQDGTIDKGILGKTTSLLNQRTDGRAVAQTIHTSMEDGTGDRNRVLVTPINGIDDDRVTIFQTEVGHIKLRDTMAREMFPTDTTEADSLLISFRCIATCILQQGCHTLVLLHLIRHRALDITNDINDAVVRTDNDDIAIRQTDITRETAIEDIVIDIDNGQLTTATIDLDATESTQFTDATSHVKGMEDRSEGRERISARRSNLTHHIDGNRACLTDGHPDAGLAITLSELILDLLIGLFHRETAKTDRSEVIDRDRSFR